MLEYFSIFSYGIFCLTLKRLNNFNKMNGILTLKSSLINVRWVASVSLNIVCLYFYHLREKLSIQMMKKMYRIFPVRTFIEFYLMKTLQIPELDRYCIFVFLSVKALCNVENLFATMLQIHTTANWIEWIIQSCGNVLNPAHFNGFNFNLLLAIKTILIAFYFVSIVIIGLLLCPFRLKEKS